MHHCIDEYQHTNDFVLPTSSQMSARASPAVVIEKLRGQDMLCLAVISDAHLRKMEDLLSEANDKNEDLHKLDTDQNNSKNKLLVENSDLTHQVEELENRISQLNRTKLLLASQTGDLKKQLDEESKTTAVGNLANLKLECKLLKEQLEEELECKSELETDIETQHRQHPLENEKAYKEAEEAVEATQIKCNNLEKTKQRLQGEIEDVCMDLEKIADLSEQLMDAGKSTLEFQKSKTKSEIEKEEMQVAYEEAEAALEVSRELV
ncbi:hypothetical protein XELAEV_18046837mg [Xenopus laevis]|uniref:Uncharacterized protein n=1 Tax=Xenopus laevis TaxID=8355 RepID=A0A974H180_XENLA|nr:hypothetical protein XELAEV_18046837mg [Xenopus laevis]